MIHRLNYLMLVACVLLSSGCGCSAGNLNVIADTSGIQRGLRYEQESAQLVSSLPVSQAVADIVSHGDTEVADNLPPLSFLNLESRGASAVTAHTRTGADYFAASDKAFVYDTSRLLMLSPDGPTFAIYEVNDAGQLASLETLTVNTSDGDFSGDDPGYWVGIANFDADRWDILGRSESSEYLRNFGGTTDYTSNTGNLYVFVLVTDGQVVTIDSVSLETDYESAWTDVEVDSGPDAGWTPAITFLHSDNVMVAYSDYDSTDPMYAAIDRSYDVSNPANWHVSAMALTPSPQLAHWMDITVDPAGNPVATMVVSNVGSGTENSQLAYAVYADQGNETFAWNFLVLPEKDGLEYTSVARNPLTGIYTVAFTAANLNSSSSDYELYLELINLGDPDDYTDDSQSIISGFADRYPDATFYYPHLDIRTTDGFHAVCTDGGYVYGGMAGDADGWTAYYTEANSGRIGSVAFNPVSNLLGHTFSHNTTSSGTFDYVDYTAGMVGYREVVDSIEVNNGETIGESSQLAFTDSGAPGIAYTQSDGSATNIMFAYWNGTGWSLEQVNDEPLYPGGERVFVDLDFDSTDLPGICWNHVTGTDCSLHVALRGV